MDYLFIEKCVDDLSKLLLKRRFQEAGFNGSNFSLSFGKLNVEFVLSNPNAIYLSKSSYSSEAFKRLKGAFLKSVSTVNRDRVIKFELLKILLSGKTKTFYIFVELTGKDANVILTDEEGKILEVFREFEGSYRWIKRGVTYIPPPMEKKEFSEIEFGKVTSEGIKTRLYKFVRGISPLNSREISLIFEQTSDLNKAFSFFMDKHVSSNSAYLYFENGKPFAMTTFAYESLKHFNCEVFSGETPFLNCWRRFAELKEQEKLFQEKRKLLERLKSIEKRLQEEIESFKDVESLLKEAEEKRWKGELLKYSSHLIRGGMSTVKVKDFQTGNVVEVEIDSSLSPKENVEKLFKLYRRLKRKAELSRYNLSRITNRLDFIRFLMERVEKATSFEELEQVRSMVVKGKVKNGEEKKTFRKYKLSSGREIVIGRNNFENEFISMKLANPWDMWFHAKEMAGSHVVLRLNKNEKPEDRDIVEAASAAAYFSKGRNSGKVIVDYTLAKYLRKPKGTPPGFVTYKDEKSIVVSPSDFNPKI